MRLRGRTPEEITMFTVFLVSLLLAAEKPVAYIDLSIHSRGRSLKEQIRLCEAEDS